MSDFPFREKLDEFIRVQLGLNTDGWDEQAIYDCIVNMIKNMQDNLLTFRKDYSELKNNFENLKNSYISLRDISVNFNNDFYEHVYGKRPESVEPEPTEEPVTEESE